MKTMTITIYASDIKKAANKGSPYHCLMAIGVRRELQRRARAEVARRR